MAIKQDYQLTRLEFDDALVRLRLNVSEVSKATGVPRSYMSEFRHGDRQLRPEHLAMLRDYFETNGLVFENISETSNPANSLTSRVALSVADEVSQQTLASTLDTVQDNDARLAVLFQQQASRENGFLSSGGFSKETTTALQEIFSLLSLNYVLYRTLSGWPAFQIPAGSGDLETLRDIVFSTYKTQLESVGVFVAALEGEQS